MTDKSIVPNNLVSPRNTNSVYKIRTKYLLTDLQIHEDSVDHYFKNFITDFFYLHYLATPGLVNSNDDPIMQEILNFFKDYTNKDEYRRVRNSTIYDENLSEYYTVKYIQEFSKILAKKKEELQQMLENEKQKQKNNQTMQNMIQKAQELLNNNQTMQAIPYLFALSSASQELKRETVKINGEVTEKVKKETETLKNLLPASGQGSEKATLSFNDMRELAEIQGVNKIVTLAKKLTDDTMFVKRIKEESNYGDYDGVKVVRDISKATEMEILLFTEGVIKEQWLGYRKVTSKEGSYYILLDKSGSMEGNKILWAKSVALALYKIAKKKKRKFFLRFFDSSPYDLLTINDIKTLKDFLRSDADGGTDIQEALLTAFDDISKNKLGERLNDVIIISDGISDVNADLINRKKKELNARITFVLIGEDANVDEVKKYADKMFSFENIGDKEAKMVLKEVS